MGHETATLSRLGPYALLEELGSGAMGTVYLAHEESEERQVALKVLHPHLLERKGFFQRFQREALAGERVRHPNVVRTLDCDIHVAGETGYCLLVMEYVKGRTLRDLLEEWTTVPETLVREIGQQAAQGLAAIHEAGLVHRDLKPENVLITDDHRVRIMDLGVARHTELSTALTGEGHFAGSLLYAAPEQFQGGSEVGPAADLYALGVVLYELVSGTNPFRHDEPGAVVNAHLDFVPERLDRRTEEASPFLSEVVATLLAKDRTGRFAAAADLAAVLAEGTGSSWWGGRERARIAERTRRPQVPVRRETRVYGRGEDLALLEDAWNHARRGEGNAVLLEGEAGIGKSRLVDQFLRDLDGQDAHVLYGSYSPSGGVGAIIDALVEHFGRADLEDALRPYLTRTPTTVPALAAVLRREVPPEGAPSLQGDGLHGVLVHLMQALAARRPLVWVIEDLHFAGADRRKLVLSLARAVAGHGVLLLLTTRPGFPKEELAHFGRLESFRRTNLTRLGARDIILLLEDAFHSVALAEKLGVRIAKKSDGVPFFVFEMIRGLRDGQFITQLPDGSWIESKVIDDIEVPSAVRELIAIRLGDLSKEERAILDVGATQGFEFDPDLVARVLDRPRVAVLQDAADIERRSGVLRAKGRRVRFDHHQIQEVLYAELPRGLREAYHSLLAVAYAHHANGSSDGLDAYFLSSHHLRGSRPREGLLHLIPALDYLEQSYRSEAAIDLARWALRPPGLLTGEARVEALLRMAGSLDLRGAWETQSEALEEAHALVRHGGDAVLRSRVGKALGESLRRISDFPAAEEHLRDALDLARGAGDRPGEVNATEGLGRVCLDLGRYEEARDRFETALTLAREIGDAQGEARATGSLGTACFYLGRHEDARAHYERHLALSCEIGNRGGEANARGNLALALSHLGHTAEALAQRERGLALSREIGDRPGEASATGGLGSLFLNLGRYEEARAQFEKHLALSREIGDRHGEATATESLGRLCRETGCFEEARALHEKALDLLREIGNRHGEATATGNLGILFFSLGRYEEARVQFAKSLAVSREIGHRRGEARATGNLGVLCKCVGRSEEALAHFAEHLALARAMGYRQAEARSTGNLGNLYTDLGRNEQARSHLEEFRALAHGIGARPQEGHALGSLGRLAEQRGDLEEAYRLHGEALALQRELSDTDGVIDNLLVLGRLDAAREDEQAATARIEEAVALAEELKSPRLILCAVLERARLAGGDVQVALNALETHEEQSDIGTKMIAHFRLWGLTQDAFHLDESHRLLCFLRDHAPEAYRESMLENVPLHREIMEAWGEHGEKTETEGDDD